MDVKNRKYMWKFFNIWSHIYLYMYICIRVNKLKDKYIKTAQKNSTQSNQRFGFSDFFTNHPIRLNRTVEERRNRSVACLYPRLRVWTPASTSLAIRFFWSPNSLFSSALWHRHLLDPGWSSSGCRSIPLHPASSFSSLLLIWCWRICLWKLFC